MNWKLIFLLSLFGLAMGIATVYYIPTNFEPFFWLPIFIFCAYIIAKNSIRGYFFTGFCVSLINSIWVSATHIILFDAYVIRHATEAKLYANSPMQVSPKVAVFVFGVLFGIGSGLVLGLFSVIASRIIKRSN